MEHQLLFQLFRYRGYMNNQPIPCGCMVALWLACRNRTGKANAGEASDQRECHLRYLQIVRVGVTNY